MAKDKIPTGAAVEKEINGVTYGTRHMDPEKLLLYSGRVVGMTAAAVMSRTGDSGIMEVLRECFGLAMADARELGKNDYWKVHFLGKPKDLIHVVAWMLEVHFADFFVEALSVANDLKERFGGLLDSKGQTPQ